jgi:sterol desaturase/sphingolipid hydroxylase (fatty acid hydroxylase superfamily)
MLIVAIAFPLVIAGSILQASFFEWAFHRYWLHRPWLPKECFTFHTLVHHQLCKFEDTFQAVEEEQHEALTFQWWGGPLLIAINCAPWALLAWILSASGIALPWVGLIATGVGTFALYYAGYEGLHHLMHKPRWPWVQNLPYFRFIERHHRIHHVRMNRNLNVLLPIADFCLGTLVLQTAIPATTPEAARKVARRHSRYGKRLRQAAP